MSLRVLCFVLFCCPGLVWAGETGPLAPEFSQTDAAAWLNSKPLSLADLRGQVLMVEFWTFACGNCVNSIPWVKAMEERYREQGLQVIGVHTPEFSYERSAATVAAHMKKLGVRHPVMLDNDYAYWNAMGNRYWPAFFLIDKQGHVRQAYAGEVNMGSSRSKQIEAELERLIVE
jgi:thiol-disulfide isomerase/thioredoxin